MKGIVVRNVLTKDLLLILAQVNSQEIPYVDAIIDTQKRGLYIRPVTVEEYEKRTGNGKGSLNIDIEGAINDDI